jgi:hypothetical protein
MRKLFVLPACLERALKNTIPEKITAECRIELAEIKFIIYKVQNDFTKVIFRKPFTHIYWELKLLI